jgi:hypothetical protein
MSDFTSLSLTRLFNIKKKLGQLLMAALTKIKLILYRIAAHTQGTSQQIRINSKCILHKLIQHQITDVENQ